MSYNSASCNPLLLSICASAAASAAGLIFAQTDYFSRHFLSHDKLQTKRKQEYSYRWDTCLKRARLRYYKYAENELGEGTTTILKNEIDLLKLITEWLEKKKKGVATPCWRILGISREENDGKEVYLEFECKIKVPLVSFGMMLAEAFEEKITTTALCFVADASSGLGSELLADMMDTSKAGVAIIREPVWMVAFASLVEQKIITREKMKRILFGLCRLEAWRVRDQVGDARTVMFTLPGQAVTPILLPLLQNAFPEDRHVFAYDNCVNSVRRADFLRSRFNRGNLPKTTEEIWMLSHDPTRNTTPLVLSTPLSKTVYGLSAALCKLPINHADTVEAWIGSVDSFFKLKDEETTNGYLPYVLRLDYIVNQKDLAEGSDRYWSVNSLLQFITGCRSRVLPGGVRDAAMEWLRDFSTKTLDMEEKMLPKLSGEDLRNIEDSVFQHKSILIQDKTLKDTVLPSKHWTLKQAVRKGGCACCAPEEDDDDEEEGKKRLLLEKARGNVSPIQRDNEDEKEDSITIGGLNNKYVDGKTTFAFDPTAFSVPAASMKKEKPKYVDGKMTFAFDPTKFS